jgi:hypothetical protein
MTTAATRQRGRALTIAGFASAGVAVWVYWLVCGAAAIAFGAGAMAQGDRLGRWSVLAGVCGLVGGGLLSLMPHSFFS